MSKILSGFMQKMHLTDDEYQEEFDDLDEFEEEEEEPPKPKKEKKGSRFGQKTKSRKQSDLDDDSEFDDIDDDSPAPVSRSSSRTSGTGRNRNKIVSMRRGTSDRTNRSYYSPSMEVCLLKPIDVDSAEEICDAIIEGKAVIVNFVNVNDNDRQRIVDMASGTTYAVEGRLKLINEMIAVFTPKDIDITGDLEEFASSSISVPSLGYQDYDYDDED